MATDPANSRAERLRGFYGLGQAEEKLGGSTEPSEEKKEEHSATVSSADLAATRPLGELIRMATSLSDSACLLTDIRELNGDRQSLVYNHHQELVAAAETVGKMRSGIDELNQSREALGASFAEIEGLCESLSTIPERPEADIKWSSVYPIVALPEKLAELAKERQQEELESTWKTYLPVLEAWEASCVSGVSDLLNSCRTAARISA